MTSDRLRAEFLSFFKKKKHKIIPSDSLIPHDDPTLLFTGAGMNQFKEQFLGRNVTFTRAATCQKCLRTADLDKVGKTSGHHTFFEMLGNFSFGDYFKKEAITWTWEFLTVTLKLPEEKLWASVYTDDDEAYYIWKDLIGLREGRIVRLGDKENFWPSEAKKNGPNGPCGPCSEVFYDWGPDAGCGSPACGPSCECGRFVEVWNLVFTQYNRKEGGILEELPRKNIDTGMGLERLTAVIQGARTNFEIDSFKPLIDSIAAQLGYKYGVNKENDSHINAIADHGRAITFAIGDGVRPSNEGRGFVIRKLIRRSSQRARLVGSREPFIYGIVPLIAKIVKGPYPELFGMREDIAQIILREEEAMREILDSAAPNMEERFLEIKKRGSSIVPADIIFMYYDEKGIPLDLIEEKAALHNLGLDMAGFNKLLDGQRRRSREAGKAGDSIFFERFLSDKKTDFLADSACIEAKILAVSKESEFIHVALDKTVFYGESGGQLGDKGVIENNDFRMIVEDAKRYGDTIDHIARVVKGEPKPGDRAKARIDLKRRLLIAGNHTATHLLHAALKKVLGRHVNQYGSLVAPDRLRFDFTHPAKLEPSELKRVEELVNEFIKGNHKVETRKMSLEAAKKEGAVALFGEKYGEEVTVRSIGSISKELCGGTHVKETGDIGVFKIISESSIASGVRRIEALTGEAVYVWLKEDMKRYLALYRNALKNIKSLGDEEPRPGLRKIERYLEEKLINIESLMEKDASGMRERDLYLWNEELKPELTRAISDLDKEAKAIQKRQKIRKELDYKSRVEELIKESRLIEGLKVISKEIEDADSEDLRELADMIKERTDRTVIVLAASKNKSVYIVFGLTEDLISRGLDAGRLIKEVAGVVGGSGGGRPDLAQAGGKAAEKLKEALDKVYDIIKHEVSK